MSSIHAGEDVTATVSPPATPATPTSGTQLDYSDFSVPVGRFFMAEALSDRLTGSGPDYMSGRSTRADASVVSGKVGLSYEADPDGNRFGRVQVLSRRERNEPGLEEGGVVLRTFYGAKRLLENVGNSVRFDRSFFSDVELQETSFGTKLKEDPHDIRTVLSASRFGFSVPLHQKGLTKVSLELNADRLFQAFKGDVPQLRGGLQVRF
jgi:hypothetical protein